MGYSKRETKQQENSIYNKWNLVKFEPGSSPTENFNHGEISWTFNSDYSLVVSIVNGTEVSDRVPLNTSGSYAYSIKDNELTFDNKSFGYEVINDELILSTFIELESDGMRITFSKAELNLKE